LSHNHLADYREFRFHLGLTDSGIRFCLTREDTFATLKSVKNKIIFLKNVSLKRI
jgi:hypothetical protein